MSLLPLRRQPRPRLIRFLFIAAATLIGPLTSPELAAQASAASGAGKTQPVFEEWVVIFLDGKQCGFGSTITTETDTPGGPNYDTVHQEVFVIKRLNTDLKFIDTSRTTEDAEGGVLSFNHVTASAGSNIECKGVREGDDLVVSSRGQTQRYHLPRLDALGPEKVRRRLDAMSLKPGQSYSLKIFSADYPQAAVIEQGTIVDQEARRVRGAARKLWKVTSEMSLMPGLQSTVWVDDHGRDVESLDVIPGVGDLHGYVTDRAECMKQPHGAEIFATFLIRPQRAIPSPDHEAQAVYRLTSVDLSKKLALWDQGEQRVLSSEPGTCEVQVTTPTFTPTDATWSLPHPDTPELHPYLQASAYLEVGSLKIHELSRLAVGNETNPVKAAQRIESFVKRYITKKDLNVGFASAEETAQSREGDCTEHAVLCAALGRAAGLPTRCVFGFGYIPPGAQEPTESTAVDKDTGIFAFHMWAEAWIGPDRWMPMDAALNGFDVGHIAITKTALEEINPLADLNAPILQLMENIKIQVIKTVPKAGQTEPVVPDAPTSNAAPGID